MPSFELVIEPKAPAGGRAGPPRAAPKSRAFRAQYLAHVCARGWWPGDEGSSDATRPAWLLCAASARAARPFVANLQTGHRALLTPYHAGGSWAAGPPVALELRKSAGYRFLWQRVPAAGGVQALVTAYLPDLVRLDPGFIDPDGVRFLALTPQWWIAQETARAAADPALPAALTAHAAACGWLAAPRPGGGPPWTVDALLALLPQAVHAVTYLERRTTRPAGQHAGLRAAALPGRARGGPVRRGPPRRARGAHPGRARGRDGAGDGWDWARARPRPPGVVACGTAAAGLAPPVACRVDHPTLDAFLGQEVVRYFAAQARAAAAGGAAGRGRRPAMSADPRRRGCPRGRGGRLRAGRLAGLPARAARQVPAAGRAQLRERLDRPGPGRRLVAGRAGREHRPRDRPRGDRARPGRGERRPGLVRVRAGAPAPHPHRAHRRGRPAPLVRRARGCRDPLQRGPARARRGRAGPGGICRGPAERAPARRALSVAGGARPARPAPARPCRPRCSPRSPRLGRPEGAPGAADAAPIPAGRRNATLASLAGTMRRRAMSPAAITAALLVENAARCVPPLPVAEVRRIAASIGRYPPGGAPPGAAPLK